MKNWCKENDMLLNVSKRKFVSLCRRRKKTTVQYDYHVQNSRLEKCAIINDLGIMLKSTF